MPVVTKYQDTLADAATGRPVAKALVTVYDYPSGALSTRYNETGTQIITDAIITDSNGYFSFYVIPGHYQISIAGNGILRQLTDLLVGPSPPGLPGPQGQGFTWTGDWKADYVYAPYSVVFRGGNSYVAVQQSLGADPAADTAHLYWDLFVSGVMMGVARDQAEEDALVAAGYKIIIRDEAGTTAPPTTPAPTTPTTPTPTTPAPTTPAPTTPQPTTTAQPGTSTAAPNVAPSSGVVMRILPDGSSTPAPTTPAPTTPAPTTPAPTTPAPTTPAPTTPAPNVAPSSEVVMRIINDAPTSTVVMRIQ